VLLIPGVPGVLSLGVLGVREMTEVGIEKALKMMLGMKAGGGETGTAVIVKNGIVEGKHVDGMNRSMMETMEENEVGMKVQGGHQVCSSCFCFYPMPFHFTNPQQKIMRLNKMIHGTNYPRLSNPLSPQIFPCLA
jgi:hypothetical protein